MIQSFIIVFLRSCTDGWMLVLHGVVISVLWRTEKSFMNTGIQRTFSLTSLHVLALRYFRRPLPQTAWLLLNCRFWSFTNLSSSCFRHDNFSFGVFQAVERCLKIHFPVFSKKGKKVSLLSYWNIYLVIFLYQVRIKVATLLLVLSKTSGLTRKWKNTQGNKEEGALFLECTCCSDIQISCLYFCCILFCRHF